MSVKRTRRSACDDLDDMHKRLKALNARLSQTRADYDAQINALETVVAQTQTTIIQKKAERDAQLNAIAADRDRTRSVTDELEEFVRDIDKGGAALRKWQGHAFLRCDFAELPIPDRH